MKLFGWLFIPIIITIALMLNIYSFKATSLLNDILDQVAFIATVSAMIAFLMLINAQITKQLNKFIFNYKLIFWIEMGLYLIEILIIVFYFRFYLPYSKIYYQLFN